MRRLYESATGKMGAFVLALWLLAGPTFLPVAADEKNAMQRKPILIMIFDKNCKTWCSQVRPVVADLKKSYETDFDFAEIDVTRSVLDEAKAQAKELGIAGLLPDTLSYVPLVLICEGNRKNHVEFVGPKSRDEYENCMKKIMAKRR